MESNEVLEMLDNFASKKKTPNARDFLKLIEYMRHCRITELEALKKFGQNEITM